MSELIVTRGRELAREAWLAAEHSLERIRQDTGTLGPMPERAAFAALEYELGRALSAAEEGVLVHAYRSELHCLNAELELAQHLARRRHLEART